MSIPENLFAFTEPGSGYPAYISVNRRVDDDRIHVTVRSAATGQGGGETAEIALRPDQARELAHSILSGVR